MYTPQPIVYWDGSWLREGCEFPGSANRSGLDVEGREEVGRNGRGEGEEEGKRRRGEGDEGGRWRMRWMGGGGGGEEEGRWRGGGGEEIQANRSPVRGIRTLLYSIFLE